MNKLLVTSEIERMIQAVRLKKPPIIQQISNQHNDSLDQMSVIFDDFSDSSSFPKEFTYTASKYNSQWINRSDKENFMCQNQNQTILINNSLKKQKVTISKASNKCSKICKNMITPRPLRKQNQISNTFLALGIKPHKFSITKTSIL